MMLSVRYGVCAQFSEGGGGGQFRTNRCKSGRQGVQFKTEEGADLGGPDRYLARLGGAELVRQIHLVELLVPPRSVPISTGPIPYQK
eukprot:1811369-Rhodomonas_salina.1